MKGELALPELAWSVLRMVLVKVLGSSGLEFSGRLHAALETIGTELRKQTHGACGAYLLGCSVKAKLGGWSWRNRWCSVATLCCDERLGVWQPEKKEKVHQCVLQSWSFHAGLGIGIKSRVFSSFPTPLLLSKNVYKHFRVICGTTVAAGCELKFHMTWFSYIIFKALFIQQEGIFIVHIKSSIWVGSFCSILPLFPLWLECNACG